MPRAEVLILDTHVWIDVALGRTNKFSKRARRRVEAAAQAASLYVAAITPWEVAMLVRRGKIRVSGAVLDFIVAAMRETCTAVASLDPAIAVDAGDLPAWDHGDPADRIIVATTRALDGTLLTWDEAILDYATSVKAVRAIDPS